MESYDYNAKVATMVLCILLFSACSAFFGWMAYTNDSELTLRRFFTLSKTLADVFYWVWTIISLGFVFLGGLAIAQRFSNPQLFEVTDTSFRIPAGFIKKKVIEVSYDEVIDFAETATYGQRFLELRTLKKKYCLNRALMPSREAYEEAKNLICSAVSGHN